VNNRSIKKILTYLAILLVLSSIFYAVILSAGTLSAGGGIYVFGLMWMPGVSGIITQLIFEHSLRGMGWKPGKFKYLLLGYVIPLAYCLVVYGITWLTGLGNFSIANILPALANYTTKAPQNVMVIIYLANLAVFGVFLGLLSGTGEELGWRGVLLPELMKVTTFNKATLISGTIWTLWHLPLILFADYITPGIPRWYGVLMFTLMVTGMNFVFSWLRAQSGSFWPAAVLHASHNLFVQSLFTPLTSQTKVTPYIIDEFGIGLALIGILLALIFFEKKKSPALQVPVSAPI
jgi:uncharacterized protein